MSKLAMVVTGMLPAAVQRLPLEAQALWTETYNATMNAMENDELKAYATAWRRVREHWSVDDAGEWKRNLGAATAQKPTEKVQLAIRFDQEAALATEHPPVEFLRTGTFYDMWGTEVKIDVEFLDAMVAHFDEGKAKQSLPVDVDHHFAEAVGWIKSIWRTADRALAEVEWNAAGMELLADKLYRYVSSSLHLEKQLLNCFSLVNFPAVKGLSPVELSEAQQGYLYIGGETETDVLVQASGAQVKPVTKTEGEQAMPNDTIAKIDLENLDEAGMLELAAKFGMKLAPIEESKPAAADEPGDESDDEATPLSPDFKALAKQMATLAQLPSAEAAGMEEQLRAELQVLAQQIYDQAQVDRKKYVAEAMAQLVAEKKVTEFARAITSEGKAVLREQPTKLSALLLRIDEPEREEVMALLGRVQQHGLIPIDEYGTSEDGKGTQLKALTPDMLLGMAMVTNSDGKPDREAFFEANKELGKMEDYDWSAVV